MIVDKAEAHKYWCPQGRVRGGHAVPVNRGISDADVTMCLGPRCMWWVPAKDDPQNGSCGAVSHG
jgi:hypothetical protein